MCCSKIKHNFFFFFYPNEVNRAGILQGNSTLCSGSVPCKRSGFADPFEPAFFDLAAVLGTFADASGTGCSFASGALSRPSSASLASVPSDAPCAAASSFASAETCSSYASSLSEFPAGASSEKFGHRPGELYV